MNYESNNAQQITGNNSRNKISGPSAKDYYGDYPIKIDDNGTVSQNNARDVSVNHNINT